MSCKYRWIVAVLMGLGLSGYTQWASAEVPVVDESVRFNSGSRPAPAPRATVSAVQDNSDSDEDDETGTAISTAAKPAAASGGSLEQRVARLEKQVSSGTQADVLSQLEDLRHDMADLREQIEMTNHQVQQLGQKQATDKVAAAPAAAEDQADPKELQAYQKAYDAIKAKDFDRAKSGFQDYLSQYRNGSFAGNAHYWLGEIYLHQNSYSKAASEFNQVISNPKNAKYPEAMLKLGFLYYQQGAWQQARQQLELVRQKFPNTTVATLAASKLQDMTQAGH